MSKIIYALGAGLLTLTVCVVEVCAQDADAAPDAPGQLTAPYPSRVPWGNATETTADPGQILPAQRPLAGVQPLALGKSWQPYSFWLPSISVTSQVTTNPPGSGYKDPRSINYLLGHLDLHHVSGRSELVLGYTGGGMLSTNYLDAGTLSNGGNVNSVIQDLRFSDRFSWQRWSLLLGDEGSYLSASSFGFGGLGGLGFLGGTPQLGLGGVFGGTLPFLNAFVTPNQTIPTAIGPQLSDTAVLQVGYQISPGSSWTAAGSYGLLRFVDAGYINSRQALFLAGYSYKVSPLTSLAVLYRFEIFLFANLAQGIDDHVVQLAYARHVTGRLNFQIAAGPDLATFRKPLTGSPTNLSWSAGTSVSYQLARTALSLLYDHLHTAGSGVLVGAKTDQVQGAISRTFSHAWQGTLSFGDASNRYLTQTTPNSVQGFFNYWYAAAQVSHQLRPGMSLFFGYGANLNTSNTVACGTPNCGSNFVTHTVSLGFNWGLRPFAPGGR